MATSHQRYPSSLTLTFHHRFHFPWPLFAYKVATHPNVTFYLKFQDVEIEEPCFPFLSSFFSPLFSRFTFHPFFHGTAIDYRNPLFPYFSADTLVSFFVDGFPRITSPSARFDSGEFVHATYGFFYFDWLDVIPIFLAAERDFIFIAFIYCGIMVIININDKSKKFRNVLNYLYECILMRYGIWKKMHGKKYKLMDGKNLW